MLKHHLAIAGLLWANTVVEYTFFFMQKYLTSVWKLSFTHAAAILNIWGGTYRILPVFFLFLAESFLGHFMTLVISAISSSVGLVLVTMSALPEFGDSTSTGSCKENELQCVAYTEKALFFTGLALVAVGRAARIASTDSFADKQTLTLVHEDEEFHGLGTLMCDLLIVALFIIFLFLAWITPAVGSFAFAYIKKWYVLFGLAAICATISALFYLSLWRTYNKPKPQGSPITAVCRVFVAAALKVSRPLPKDDTQFYVKDDDKAKTFSPTRFLGCLEKAAIKLPGVSLEDQVKSRWRLCSVEEVEATKIMVRMVPMWITFIISSIVSSTGNTYFMEQASHMNSRIGKWKVPPQILLLIFKWARPVFTLFAVSIREIAKYAASSRSTETSEEVRREVARTDGSRRGIIVGMIVGVLCCITAAQIERRRLKVITRHGLLDKPNEVIPMTAYWLLFQYSLLGMMEAFLEMSVAAFYRDQTPRSLRKYVGSFGSGVSGLGFMCSVLSVYAVGKLSETGGRASWFQYTLNRSHLDRYYWVLAALCSLNLITFIVVASCYRFKDPQVLEVETAGESDYEFDDEILETMCMGKSTPLGFMMWYIHNMEEEE